MEQGEALPTATSSASRPGAPTRCSIAVAWFLVAGCSREKTTGLEAPARVDALAPHAAGPVASANPSDMAAIQDGSTEGSTVPLTSGPVRAAAHVLPTVVLPEGARDDELLDARNWQRVGFPALSRDGLHIAAIFSPSSASVGIVDSPTGNFNEPDRIVDFPNTFFVVASAVTGAMESRALLVSADEFSSAQRRRSTHALAVQLRKRLADAHRAVGAGGYQSLESVRPSGETDVEVDGMRVHVSSDRLSVTDSSNRPRLAVELREWRGQPLRLSDDVVCVYTPRIEQVALDEARRVAVFLTWQSVEGGGDACLVSPNADSSLRVLRLAP